MKLRILALSLVGALALGGAAFVLTRATEGLDIKAEVISSDYESVSHRITIDQTNPLVETNQSARYALPLDNGVYANFYTSGSSYFNNDPSTFEEGYDDCAFYIMGSGHYFELTVYGYQTPNTYLVNGNYMYLYGFDAFYKFSIVYATPNGADLQISVTNENGSQTNVGNDAFNEESTTGPTDGFYTCTCAYFHGASPRTLDKADGCQKATPCTSLII